MNAPRATARLQLHAGFTLDDARAQLPYYAALGVSHLYLSPITEARHGSTHGYDVIDHQRVSGATWSSLINWLPDWLIYIFVTGFY